METCAKWDVPQVVKFSVDSRKFDKKMGFWRRKKSVDFGTSLSEQILGASSARPTTSTSREIAAGKNVLTMKKICLTQIKSRAPSELQCPDLTGSSFPLKNRALRGILRKTRLFLN